MAFDFDDNEICALTEEIRGLVVLALGEGEYDLAPDHFLAKRARRELAAIRDALLAVRKGK